MTQNDGNQIVVPTELEGAGAYINGMASTIADELAALRQQLEPLQDTWTGQAAVYFQGLEQEWNQAAQCRVRVHDMLDTLFSGVA